MKRSEFAIQFGHRIKALRREAGWTQESLAERIGLSVDAVSNIERGLSLTRLTNALQMAQLFKMELWELFYFPTSAPRTPQARERTALMKQMMEMARRQSNSRLKQLLALARALDAGTD